MPDLPDNGDWTVWIIGTLMSAIGLVVTTIIAMAKRIESSYQKDVDELKGHINELQKASDECQEDRLALSVRVASLEATQPKNRLQREGKD